METSLNSLLVPGLALMVYLLAFTTAHEAAGLASDCGEPLFLTPLIRQGQMEKAKEKSRVKTVAGMDFESYSGYFTVRGEPDNANVFFWFFPAVNNSKQLPILLWVSGGPGVTPLNALFTGTGPYIISSNGTLVHQTDHWLTFFNIIYLEFPVGTGYSFASSTAFYNRNLTDMGKDLMEGVQQFFTLFSEYTTNDFYPIGESYGGKCATILAQELYARAQTNHSINGSSIPLNLKGVITMSAPINKNRYVTRADFLHTHGILTTEQCKEINEAEQPFYDAVLEGNADLANSIIRQMILGSNSSRKVQLIEQYTGFNSFLNLFKSYKERNIESVYLEFVQRPDVRQAIHVGTKPYHKRGDNEVSRQVHDLWMSMAPNLESILNKGCRVLLMYGTSDIDGSPLTAQKMVGSLKWKGVVQFNATERAIWKLDGNPEVAGYVTPAQDLWLAFVRNSGHLISKDQPRASLDLLTRFMSTDSTF